MVEIIYQDRQLILI